MEDDLIAAISHRFVVSFNYKRQPRTVHPHALIRTDHDGQVVLHAWQVEGKSNTRALPCWGNFHVGEIAGLVVLDEPFGAAQPDFHRDHFLHVIHSL
jgi:WYL domain-containing protein